MQLASIKRLPWSNYTIMPSDIGLRYYLAMYVVLKEMESDANAVIS
jgi:hypothetical protein